ncbi:MAG: PHP domain-containing protein, partial [Dehalococcoidia bacterium]
MLRFDSAWRHSKISIGGAVFSHLHVHTEYSMLDGLSRLEPLVARAADLGMNSLAITDHGGMY